MGAWSDANGVSNFFIKVAARHLNALLGLCTGLAINLIRYPPAFAGLSTQLLNAEWFVSTAQALVVISPWLRQYNHVRPYEALSMRAPVPETIQRTTNWVAWRKGALHSGGPYPAEFGSYRAAMPDGE